MTSEEHIAQIKTVLEEHKKGTMAEVKAAVDKHAAEAIEAEKAEKAERDKLYTAATAQIAEVQTQAKELQKQIRQLLSTQFDEIKAPDGTYRGFWPSLQMAKNFGLWIMAEIGRNGDAAKELDGQGIERRRIMADGEIVNVKDLKAIDANIITGGALIPTQFMGLMPVLLGRYGVFRADAMTWPMASDNAEAAVQTSDVVVYAPGAGTAPTATNPGFKNIGLNAKKMMTLTAINSECTEDMAIAIGEVVGRSIARAFAKNEDKIGFLGDGTSTYFGFVGIGQALLNVSSTIAYVLGIRVQATAGAWSAIVMDDLLAMAGLIDPDADDEDCKYYCHRNFYYTVMIKLALALGGATANEVVLTGYSRTPQFFGRPVRHTGVMPRVIAAADHFPLFLGNLKQAALLGESRVMSIESSRDAYFTTDQIGIRGTERVALNVHGVGGLTTDTDPVHGQVVGLRADIA
jgi:HK97 family phage major capsid protein